VSVECQSELLRANMSSCLMIMHHANESESLLFHPGVLPYFRSSWSLATINA
jgi:hypothetical protein